MSGFGCGEEDIYKEIFTDRVSVIVNAQMKEAFLSETITAEDFGWDNIDRIEYNISWYENIEEGALTVYLKKTGKRRVDQAIAHFETLDFVVRAAPAQIGIIETGSPSQTVTGAIMLLRQSV